MDLLDTRNSITVTAQAPPTQTQFDQTQKSHNHSSFSSTSTSTSSCPCSHLPVIQLQSKFFPIQPRGGNLTEKEIRNAGILPVMATTSDSSSAASSIPLGKLKEPRDLYSTATLLHPIKWPVECQVIPEKIRHIDSVPSKLEPFYTPSGKEPQPQPVGIEMGTVVYDYQPKLSVDYFCRATVGGSQELDVQQFENLPSGECSLRFESRFESGNLAKAIKITNTYYELYLRPDLYTERHAQWFYFRIQGCKEGVQYRFSIVNLNKPDSLYRYGLKVLMYSEKEAQLNGVGWTRCGQNIAYFKNDISLDDNGPYYTLTFNLKFRHNNDTVYLAQCYPYTYSTLQNYLKTIEEDEFKSQLLTIRLLCRSLAGNNVHVLTVTSPDNNCQKEKEQKETQEGNSATTTTTATANTTEGEDVSSSNKKPVIVISARVHPGETQSSYMMKGIIDFLTSDCTQAKDLRDRFIFKLIPMLNPDGVIVGNSRCCLLGQDLNRQYRTVLREAFPQIYHVKVMLRRLQEENGIFLYCDLHGHSRRHNVFIYGCENRRVPEKHLMEQVFPLMMHKNAADKFSFQNCKFKIQKNKEGTGRIFVWTLGVVNSYTLEISLGGSTMPSRQCTHFNTGDYEACGRHFCETLLDYSDPSQVKETLRERILTKLIDEGSTADEPKNVVLSDYSSLSHSETEGEGDDEDDSEREDDVQEKTTSKPNSSGGSSGGHPNKRELKRQVSFRKHHNHNHNNPPGVRSKLVKPIASSRSPMPINRASVDFTRIKRKLEETPPQEPQRPNTPEEQDGNKTKEMSAAYRRLTKFRRKQKKTSSGGGGGAVGLGNFSESLNTPQQLQLTAKCTRILFDDPFNPPGTTWQRPQIYSRRQPNVPIMLNGEALSLGMDMDFNSNSAWQSGTEDECDPYDDMTIKREPPKIKITDCDRDREDDDHDHDSRNFLQNITGDMSRLRVSDKLEHRSSSDTEIGPSSSSFPTFAPFTPTLPVGKAFLHQNFYPEKSPPKSKLVNSLSDTTLSEKDPTSKGTPIGGLSPTVPIPRRSSISYGVISRTTVTSSRLQANGSPLLPKTSSPVDLNSRRRVSWTGTLTVSIPTNIPLLPKSPTRIPLQRKKSFRKSKSLNDKQSPGHSQQSSIDLNDSTSSLVASSSIERIQGGKGRLLKGPGPGYGYSLSTGSITSTSVAASVPMPGTSSARKKRAKLKRSKHK